MIQSIATNPDQTSPYRHGSILFAGVTTYKKSPPGIARCLSQGAAAGVFVGFLFPVFAMLSHPQNGYNFFLMFFLPMLLAMGLAFGVLEGVMIWACSYIVGHRLHAVNRGVLGVVTLAILLTAYNFLLFAEPSPYREEVSTIDYFFFYGVYLGYGVLFGLIIGSRFQPVPELLRGTSPPQWRALTGLTGLALRVFVIFSLMESILNMIWTVQRERSLTEFSFGVIALVHFIAAVLIIFVRMPFWLLLPLALIINFPIVALITDVLTEEHFPIRYIAIGYLSLWAAFLLTRARVPEAIKKELRYYLID